MNSFILAKRYAYLPTKSKRSHVQVVGRVFQNVPGKRKANHSLAQFARRVGHVKMDRNVNILVIIQTARIHHIIVRRTQKHDHGLVALGCNNINCMLKLTCHGHIRRNRCALCALGGLGGLGGLGALGALGGLGALGAQVCL